MKAIFQDSYGSTDVLELRDIDKPEIAHDEVLVRVHAPGVDRGVWHAMAGLPYPIRLAGYGLRAPKTPVPGMDLAGVVAAVGKDVTRFAPGDEVFGIGKGTFAEYARAPENKLVSKPADLTFEQAAAVSISGSAALQALRDHAQVEPGQKVLVIGASGGVGTYAVQLGKAFGAEVTGACSTMKVDLVRSLGADHVIDYTGEDFAEGEQRRQPLHPVLEPQHRATIPRAVRRDAQSLLQSRRIPCLRCRHLSALTGCPFTPRTVACFGRTRWSVRTAAGPWRARPCLGQLRGDVAVGARSAGGDHSRCDGGGLEALDDQVDAERQLPEEDRGDQDR